MAARKNKPRPKAVTKVEAVERILRNFRPHVVVKVGDERYLCVSDLATSFDDLVALADDSDPRYQGTFDMRRGKWGKRELMEVIE